MIQVRSVPASLHRELVKRARARDMTLTDYVQEILEREIARPPADEVFARIGGRRPVERFERSLGDASEAIRHRFYAENFVDLMGSALPSL